MIICGIDFDLIDSIEQITIADSFVKGGNKIGTGHGEAKLYVGQITDNRTQEFFNLNPQNKPIKCFILKDDLYRYLLDTKIEYQHPTQNYQSASLMPMLWQKRLENLSSKNNVLEFELINTNVTPPRIYLNTPNTNDENYNLIREFALPNLSYLSCLKLRDKRTYQIYFYFRIFADLSYLSNNTLMENEIIENPIMAKNIRDGQAKYRQILLLECPFCPVTMVNYDRLLIASHIKPYAHCNDYEKYDPKNGLMLTPTIDKLFDKGFITFNINKQIVLSPWLSKHTFRCLNLTEGTIYPNLPFDEKRIAYIQYHNQSVFKA
ncbi:MULTISPECIES: HNH endonuclease signature motif containing protein [unclassified Campylobacter]|uniref:HNH endonuclease signature motif containing protein n=1 Tax=unclassified Campylobacter TaxID=2593542 RepID=UPI001D5095A9|nr:HNH endonuclease signature motif containing protein [Campylobacter sp. RM12651]MBZ7982956.1 HNH endonuclease [Campylobacter sp. RM12647]MBZ7992171.1 HNH endonuclease [Campylobacter sp. RM9333]ULO03633.1 type II restriction/modification system, restriction endonuclease [Campylobacter sp. RM12651]